MIHSSGEAFALVSTSRSPCVWSDSDSIRSFPGLQPVPLQCHLTSHRVKRGFGVLSSRALLSCSIAALPLPFGPTEVCPAVESRQCESTHEKSGNDVRDGGHIDCVCFLETVALDRSGQEGTRERW